MTAAAPRPFRIDVPDEVLARIRVQLEAADWAIAPGDDADWRYGVDVGYLRELVEYWLNTYDWRAAEAKLNAHPQFLAAIDERDVHFQHVRGKGPAPAALLLTHGWPGSFFEFQELIGPLTDPAAHGGDPADAFDVIAPSLPGFSFSQSHHRPIGPRRVAQIWRELMSDALGYQRFFCQGGDFGAGVSMWLGDDHADVVDGVHLNFCTIPIENAAEASEAEREWQARYVATLNRESAYMFEHMTKPQTVAAVLTASPLAFAAWVIEKFQAWGDTKGDIESRFSKDDLITNLMLYLVTGSQGTAIWLYRGAAEERAAGAVAGANVTAPAAVAEFPGEILPYPPQEAVARRWNLKRWTKMSSGGHFAALEEPKALIEDVRAFCRPLRTSQAERVST